MTLNKICFRVSIIVSIIFFIVFTFFIFNKSESNLDSWITQISVSIFSSALIVAIISYITYRIEKIKFIRHVSLDMRLTFDFVDRYLIDKDASKNYIDCFYQLYESIINHDYIQFSEIIDSLRKKEHEIVLECAIITNKLRKMIYYRYAVIKQFDNCLKNNNLLLTIEDNCIDLNEIHDMLDDNLKELNQYLTELKSANRLNVLADKLNELVGIEHVVDQSEGEEYADPNYIKQGI